MVLGIYFWVVDVLDNVCDVKGAHVWRFPTLVTATAAWSQVLINGDAVPLGDIPYALLLPPGFCYPVNDDETLSNTNVSTEILVSPILHATMEPSAVLSVGDGNEWCRAAYEYGSKWVVWKGWLPGILDSLYETASIIVQILIDYAQGNNLMQRSMAWKTLRMRINSSQHILML